MAYELICQTTPMLEEFAVKEIKELTKNKASVKKPGIIEFKTKDLFDIVKLNYNARIIERVLIKLGEFSFKDMKDLTEKVKKIDFSEFAKKGKSFAARCDRTGKHEFDSYEVEPVLGDAVYVSVKTAKNFALKVDLEFPDFLFKFIIRDDLCIVALDSSGDELNKRGYKVYFSNHNLRPSIANAIIEFSGWDSSKGLFLDPYSGDGILCVEAGIKELNISSGFMRKDKFAFLNWSLFDRDELEAYYKKRDSEISKKKVKIQGMDKFTQNVDGANKNAKLAGVARDIDFSRYDIDWLDSKYGEKSVEYMIVFPPTPRVGNEGLSKFFKDIFYQAEYILKDYLIIFSNQHRLIDEFSKEYSFKVVKKMEVDYGSPHFFMYMLKLVK